MAIIRLDCNLNGGDSVTPNNELFYRIYGDVDNYAAPIWTTGTALSDANVTVDNDRVIITGVDGTTNVLFKIAAVDGSGNEGELSDAKSSGYIIDFRNVNDEGIRVPTTLAVGSSIKVNIHLWKETADGNYVMGNGVASTVNGFLSMKTQFAPTVLNGGIRDDGGSIIWGDSLTVGDGQPHSYEMVFNSATELEIFHDGISMSVRTISNFAFGGTTYISIGSYNDSGTLGSNFEMDSFEINGENFPCNEGTGTTVTGDSGTVGTFINNPLWVSV